jgi:hypothetical protein
MFSHIRRSNYGRATRHFSGQRVDKVLQPLSGNLMPRFGGPSTFMRLPPCTLEEDKVPLSVLHCKERALSAAHVFQNPPSQLDVAFVGVPLDIGTSNRPGARLGPRQIRGGFFLRIDMWTGKQARRQASRTGRQSRAEQTRLSILGASFLTPFTTSEYVFRRRVSHATPLQHGHARRSVRLPAHR